MSRHQQQRTPIKVIDNLVEVKSKYEAEYRRFALKRNGFGGFHEFYRLLQTLHHINGVDVLLGYADIHGDLLPINNDENFHKAVSLAHPVLRIIITKREDGPLVYGTNSLQRRKKGLALTGLRPAASGSIYSKNKSNLLIGPPQDFRQISSIIDVDILPETYRRVRLNKHGSNKRLGFYIRDGVSIRVTPQGVEKLPGIFISRVVPGGLAHSTGLLAVNDEIIQINSIDVAGKSLDQVTAMMMANSHNLIVTVKPANQRNNVVHRGSRMSTGNPALEGSAGSMGSFPSDESPGSASRSNTITASSSNAEGDSEDEDDECDLIVENELPPYISPSSSNSKGSTPNMYTPGREPLNSSAGKAFPQSVSLSDSMGASLSHSSSHNGNSSHSIRSRMKEDVNFLTL